MQLITTKAHGVIDYSLGILMISLPLIFNFTFSDAQKFILPVVGAITILYSLLTDYEFGLIKIISVKMHLTLDILLGLFLAVSPWLFGFNDYFHGPHVVVGMLVVLLSLVSRVFHNSATFSSHKHTRIIDHNNS